MKITFLGTGAAEGVPAMFCSCEFCRNMRKNFHNEYRSRTQVIIDGALSVDFSSEAYSNSMRFGIDLSALKYLLVTHTHMDHFYAHDFILRGYKYAMLGEDVLHIFGNDEVQKVFNECTLRELKPTVAEHICINVVKPYKEFYVEPYRILALPARHGTQEEALLYYIEKRGKGYLHLYDTGEVPDEVIDFLAEKGAKAHAVALDCTFLDAPHVDGARHMCIEDCMDVIGRLQKAGVLDRDAKLIITHFSHNAKPSKEKLTDIEKAYGVIAAYDGMTVEI